MDLLPPAIRRPFARSTPLSLILVLILLFLGPSITSGTSPTEDGPTEHWLHHTQPSSSGEAFFHHTEAFERPFRFSVDLAFMSTPTNYGKMGGLSLATNTRSDAPFEGYVLNWIDRCSCGPTGAWNFVFARYTDGVRSELAYVSGHQQPHGEAFRWAVTVDGDTFHLTVNGVTIGTFTDGTHPGALYPGFWSRAHYIYSEQHIHLDDVLVERDGTVLLSDDFQDEVLDGWVPRGGHWAIPHPPSAPTDLHAIDTSCPGRVHLSWNDPLDTGGATVRHRIYRGGDTAPIGDVYPGYNRWGEGGLALNETRTYEVRAYNEAGEGPASTVTFTAPLILPSAPRWNEWTGPALTGPGRGEVSLGWYSPVERACTMHYRVYSIDGNGTERFLGTTGDGGWGRWRDGGLADGETRAYQVSAWNAHGEGPRSAPVAVRAPWLPGVPEAVSAAPGADEGQVRLTWRAPQDTGGVPLRYQVHRMDAHEEVLLGETGWTGFVDSGRAPGSVHTYRVSSVNVVGTSDPSETATSSAQEVRRADEDETMVVIGPLGIHPREATIGNGGAVTFLALTTGVTPAGGGCFSFQQEQGRAMRIGETYVVGFRYDAPGAALEATTDGGATWQPCKWPRETTFEHAVLGYGMRYYEETATVTVRA